MIGKKRMKTYLLFILVLSSFYSFGQDKRKEICDSIHNERRACQDSLIQIYGLKKSTDSLNMYLNDRFFGILDSTLECEYPFIDFEKNNFEFFTTNSPTFEKFFFKIQQMVKRKEGKLNFFHIGGSHVQADIYTHVVRERLQSYWDDLPGERGFVFPYKMAKTNNPWNYRFTSKNNWSGYRSVIHRPDSVNYGMLGVAISCSDSVIDLNFNYSKSALKPPIDYIRIFHNKGNLGYKIEFDSILNPVQTQLTNEKLGYTDVYFKKSVTSLEMKFVRTGEFSYIKTIDTIVLEDGSADTIKVYTPYLAPLYIYGIQLSNRKPGISYTSIGVNGAGLYSYRDNENFQEQLALAKPDFMVFAVGTNDANVPYEDFDPEVYKNNLEIMMKKVYAANPDCAILLTVPNDAYYRRTSLNRNVAREREMIIDLARKYQVPVWDLYGIMGALGSSRIWRDNKLMKSDLVHFTADGYYLKGDLFFEAFMKWIEQMELRPQISILK